MYADICEPKDSASVARFKSALDSLGAELLGHGSALGVDLCHYRIDGATLAVFADQWSLDIEGPPELVQRVLARLQET